MSAITPELVAATVRDLPPLPAVVAELIASLGREDLSAEELAARLSRDQALSAKTLRLANSSFYGMSRQIGTIQEAITILGLRTVRTVVTAAGVTGAFKRPPDIGFDFDAFWRHSIGSALCAQALARETGMDPDIGFTVGLMHDIGRLALATCFPQIYVRTLAHRHEQDCPYAEAERATLGIDHTAVGGHVAEHWRFSPVIVEAIANHHSPAMHHGPGFVGLAHLADSIAHGLALSGDPQDMVPATASDIWAAMAPAPDRCQRVFAQAEAQFDGVCRALLM